MFNTLTMARLYIKQEHYKEAYSVIEELLKNDSENVELLLLKAFALEGIDNNEEAEQIIYDLIEKNKADEKAYALLEKIYTKTGKNKKNEENIPLHEIAHVYEKLNDYENAIKYYEEKINELKDKMEENNE